MRVRSGDGVERSGYGVRWRGAGRGGYGAVRVWSGEGVQWCWGTMARA